MILRSTIIALLAFGLAACATAPAPLRGEFSALSPDAARDAGVREHVRWGGVIAAVEPGSDRTCFQVVGRELDTYARPRQSDSSAGRFIACRSGFYDPQVFAEGREVTVTGRVDGSETRLIGEYSYAHPRVAADVIYLWPERREVYTRYRDPWYPYPYYHPFYRPWYGPWWW